MVWHARLESKQKFEMSDDINGLLKDLKSEPDEVGNKMTPMKPPAKGLVKLEQHSRFDESGPMGLDTELEKLVNE